MPKEIANQINKSNRKDKIQDLTLIALFSVVMAICSWITIPIPGVPFTLQTFAIFVAIGTLGAKRGTISIIVYLLLGIIGVPVFANFQSGIAYLMGPTGGYLLGFLASALVMWIIEKLFGNKPLVLGISMVIGLIICYIFGTAWFMIVFTRTKGAMEITKALSMCVLPFIIPDLVKSFLALTVSKKLRKALKLK